jgi:hypothetical protein
MAEWRVNDPDLNAPQGVAAYINRQTTNPSVRLIWTQEVTTPVPPPTIGVQVWWGEQADIWQSNIWELPYVIPYIMAFFTWNHGNPGGSPAEIQSMAAHTRDRIVYTRNKILQYHPNVDFKWAWWPIRYGGDGFIKSGQPHFGRDSLFYHYADILNVPANYSTDGQGVSSVFTANGRAYYKAKTQEFLSYLKPLLDAEGIPAPIFVDPDYEGGAAAPVGFYNWQVFNYPAWHNVIKNDPRAGTELIDGTVTYNQWYQNLKDINGNPIPENKFYPPVYSWEEYPYVGAIYTNLNARITDYGLWDCLYSPCKAIWPNILAWNWQIYGSDARALTHGWRYRESPVGFGETLKADRHFPACYGIDFKDIYQYSDGSPAAPTGLGYQTYPETLARFGINEASYTANPTTKKELMKRIYVEQLHNQLRGAYLSSNGTKGIGLSFTWLSSSIYPGRQTATNIGLNGLERRWPTFMEGTSFDFVDSPEVFVEVLRLFRKYNIQHLEFYAQNATKTALDQVHSALISGLPQAGYST